jgi:glycosyltransferase involved in cell wall biosynthesis
MINNIMAWVTILTPFFNGIEYLEECYNSVLKQTEKKWVWIIGINGHGDDTNLVYTTLKNNITDSRIIIKNYSTKGKVSTLNEMVKSVNTTYVALLDCDDVWFPNKLEIQKLILDKNMFIDVLGTNLQYIGELTHIRDLPNGLIKIDTLLKINPIVNSSVILKKECCLWKEESFGLEDYDLWFRLVLSNKILVTIPHPLIYHRIHSTSYFNNSGRQDLDGLIKYYKNMIEDVTVVSAYYPFKSKFDINQYIKWLEFWKNQPCKLVFFTSPEFVPLIEKLRINFSEKTKVIGLSFEELVAFKKFSKEFWIQQKELDFEPYHTYELYAIWYEKKEFVRKAILANYFNTSKFVWCDAGICRDDNWIPHIKTFPVAFKIPESKFLVLRITDFEQYDDFLKINCVGGGILAASKELWLEFCENYDKMIEQYNSKNKFVGKDQSIIASMIKEYPEKFELVKRFEGSNDFTCWFTLLFYLCL